MAAGGVGNPFVIPEQGFKVGCLFCDEHGATTHHALVNNLEQQEIEDNDPDIPPLLLHHAFHVVNVGYEEQTPDQHLTIIEQPTYKTLDLICTQCGSNVGMLMTDTLAGYGNIGNYFVDFLLFDDELAWFD